MTTTTTASTDTSSYPTPCLQAVTVGRRITGAPPPGIIRLRQAVHEYRQPGRCARERGSDLGGGQTDIASARAHRHTDGQRLQAGSEPVTGHGVQRGECQVACGLDDEHREYVITRPDTPLPWLNYLGI